MQKEIREEILLRFLRGEILTAARNIYEKKYAFVNTFAFLQRRNTYLRRHAYESPVLSSQDDIGNSIIMQHRIESSS
jgi:hypothetical protein